MPPKAKKGSKKAKRNRAPEESNLRKSHIRRFANKAAISSVSTKGSRSVLPIMRTLFKRKMDRLAYLLVLSARYRKSVTFTPEDVFKSTSKIRHGIGSARTFTAKLVRPRKQKKTDASDAEGKKKSSDSQTPAKAVATEAEKTTTPAPEVDADSE